MVGRMSVTQVLAPADSDDQGCRLGEASDTRPAAIFDERLRANPDELMMRFDGTREIQSCLIVLMSLWRAMWFCWVVGCT
jgi:hypothetical protein